MNKTKIDIQFDEEKHKYLVNGILAKTSVTELVERQVSKTTLAFVDQDMLARAAERGKIVHKELELFLKIGQEPTTKEAINYKKWIEVFGIEFKDHLEEKILAITWTSRNNPAKSFILAGTADLLSKIKGLNKERNAFIPTAVDYKTTSVIHTQEVRWQLSLLDYMARRLNGTILDGEEFIYVPAEEFYVFHFDKQGKFTPVKVEKISDIEIERLLDAEAEGGEYFPLPQQILTPRQVQELTDIQQAIAKTEVERQSLEQRRDILKNILLQGFKLHPDITSIKNDYFLISYIPESEGLTFDSKAFQEDYPELAKKYMKPSFKKASVRITLSKDVKEELSETASQNPNSQLVLPSVPPVEKKKKRDKAKRGYFDIGNDDPF